MTSVERPSNRSRIVVVTTACGVGDFWQYRGNCPNSSSIDRDTESFRAHVERCAVHRIWSDRKRLRCTLHGSRLPTVRSLSGFLWCCAAHRPCWFIRGLYVESTTTKKTKINLLPSNAIFVFVVVTTTKTKMAFDGCKLTFVATTTTTAKIQHIRMAMGCFENNRRYLIDSSFSVPPPRQFVSPRCMHALADASFTKKLVGFQLTKNC